MITNDREFYKEIGNDLVGVIEELAQVIYDRLLQLMDEISGTA